MKKSFLKQNAPLVVLFIVTVIASSAITFWLLKRQEKMLSDANGKLNTLQNNLLTMVSRQNNLERGQGSGYTKEQTVALADIANERIVAQQSKRVGDQVLITPQDHSLVVSFQIPAKIWDAHAPRVIAVGQGEAELWTLRMGKDYNTILMAIRQIQLSNDYQSGNVPIICDANKFNGEINYFASYLASRYGLSEKDNQICERIQTSAKPLTSAFEVGVGRDYYAYTFHRREGDRRAPQVVLAVGSSYYASYGFIADWYGNDNTSINLMASQFIRSVVQAICEDDYMGCGIRPVP